MLSVFIVCIQLARLSEIETMEHFVLPIALALVLEWGKFYVFTTAVWTLYAVGFLALILAWSLFWWKQYVGTIGR